MSDITHEQMLEALLEEKRLADARAEEARLHAIAERENVQRLDGAVAAIRALIPILEAVRGQIDVGPEQSAPAITDAEINPDDLFGLEDSFAQAEADEGDGPDRKRVPSTEWAAEIVRDAGRPMSREEVQDEFARRHGIPASWADPVASINVALKRASLKGMILRTGRALYAPPAKTTEVESKELEMSE